MNRDIAALMGSLPEPQFIGRDPDAITAEMITRFEQITGRTLYPAQVERLLVDFAAYNETLTRIAIQEAAKQTLLVYARGAALDHIALPLGVIRLPAARASTLLRLTRAGGSLLRIVVPADTLAASSDGSRLFSLSADAVLEAGSLTIDVEALSLVAGVGANGLPPGAIARWAAPNLMVDGVALSAIAVSSLTDSAGGSDAEADDAFRIRIAEAPEKFSVAGPDGAYRFWAISASPAVSDAFVTSPVPGLVRIYVLAHDLDPAGVKLPRLPTAPEISSVLAVLSDETIRPLTDQVQVLAPTRVTYRIVATVERLTGADPAAIRTAAEAAAAGYARDRRAGLGRDLVASAVSAALSVPGVYRVTVAEPVDRVLVGAEWADCTDISLTIGGEGF
jgi:phage-related baseplate assembly protein